MSGRTLRSYEKRILENLDAALDGARRGAPEDAVARRCLVTPREFQQFLKAGQKAHGSSRLAKAVARYLQAKSEFEIDLAAKTMDTPSGMLARAKATNREFMTPSEQKVARELEDTDDDLASKIAAAKLQADALFGEHLAIDSKLGELGQDGPYTVLEAEHFALWLWTEVLDRDDTDQLLARWREVAGPPPSDSRSALFALAAREEELEQLTQAVSDRLEEET